MPPSWMTHLRHAAHHGDDIKSKKDNMVAVLSAVNGDKVSLLCVCGAEAVKKVRTPATVSVMMSGVAPKNAQMGSVNTAITTASSTLTIVVSQKPWLNALLAPLMSPAPKRLPTTAARRCQTGCQRPG